MLIHRNKNNKRPPHITRYEIVHGEGTAFAFIVGEQDDANVLHRDNQGKGPDDERKSTEQILMRWIGTKCTRVDIERARAGNCQCILLLIPRENCLPNVAVDDPSRLVGQPHERPSLEFLHVRSAIVIKISPGITKRAYLLVLEVALLSLNDLLLVVDRVDVMPNVLLLSYKVDMTAIVSCHAGLAKGED